MLELMDNEFYAQNICLTGPMALILLFPSSEGVEEQNQNLTLCYGISYMYLLNILEAHPGVWEMGEQGEFKVWGTGVWKSNSIQGNK